MQQYRLTKRFALAAAILLLAAAVSLALVVRHLSITQIERMAEAENATFTRTLANSFWGDFETYLAATEGLSVETARDHPALHDLANSIRGHLQDTSILKVKLYDRHGRTGFSTAVEQIGSDYSGNPRFLAAMRGERASKLELRDRLEGVNGAVTDAWILSTYLPVYAGGQDVAGVAEIYNDVSGFHAYAQRMGIVHMAVVGTVMLIVLLLLIVMVHRAEGRMNKHHARSLKLAGSVARAEAAADEKAKFLANMSHELRTPLNAILGFADLLRMQDGPEPQNSRRRGYANNIHDAGQHLLKIISDVLDMVDLDAGRLEPDWETVELGALIRSTATLMSQQAEEKGLVLQVHVPSEPVRVTSDTVKLRQTLLNLLSNALKFTPAGGRIDVELAALRGNAPEGERSRATALRDTAREEGIDVVVSVHDFESTPEPAALVDLLADAAREGDVGKLATTAVGPEDALAMIEATHEATAAGHRVATMCMGEPGRHTRAVTPIYGSRIGYAPVDAADATAPGQYPLATLRRLVDGLREGGSGT